MAVTDSHVHLLPGRLGQKVREVFELAGGFQLAYPADHHTVCEQLAREGVGTVWSLPYAHKPGVAEGLNQASADTASTDLAVTVIGGATVHPADDRPDEVVQRGVEQLGLRVLKLHCSVGDFDPSDRRLDPVWSYASEIALPVVVHAGHAVDGYSDHDDLTPIDTVAERYPDVRLIIAHCGHRSVDAALDLLDRHPSLHADLTPVVTEPVSIAPARAASLSDRLLFGTDAPNTTLTATACLAHLDALDLDEAQRAAITGGNASRLIAGIRT